MSMPVSINILKAQMETARRVQKVYTASQDSLAELSVCILVESGKLEAISHTLQLMNNSWLNTAESLEFDSELIDSCLEHYWALSLPFANSL